jgi:hypothetical protein
VSTDDHDSSKKPDDLPPPSARQEPDFSLRGLLPWMIPAILLGVFALVLMMLNKR